MEVILGILVGGGPAPGLSEVITSITSNAHMLGWRVLGFMKGFKTLSANSYEECLKSVIEITDEYIAEKKATYEPLLTLERHNPSSEEEQNKIIENLKKLNVKHLIVIGGNEKIQCTHDLFAKLDKSDFRFVIIPKTIDNDIKLTGDQQTFGFSTARSFGAKIVNNLISDARSAPRWFIVEAMGKYTGHLTFDIASACSAHLAVIPEDFGQNNKISLKDICDVIECAMLKRLSMGKNYGVCVISEGLINKLTKSEQKKLFDNGFISMSADGNIILDEAELSRAVAKEILSRFRKRKISLGVTTKKIGYELRCAKPSSTDIVFCHELGFGAVDGLRSGITDSIVIWNNGQIFYQSISTIIDECGKIEPRYVDTNSQSYKIMKDYFWQMRPEDISSPSMLKRLSIAANLPEDQFYIQYGHVPQLTIA